MNLISILYMVFLARFVSPYIYHPLIKLCDPVKLRKSLRDEMNKTCNYLSYSKAKNILHAKLNNIDIYGDNKEDTNVEHIFPQYYFKSHPDKMQMRSDLHNLYLCNSKLNSIRQHFKYVDSKDAEDYDDLKIVDMKGKDMTNDNEELFKKRGYVMMTHRKKRVFIPCSNSRGKIARSLSYFAIKYNYVDVLEEVINIRTLVEWNLKDPVDKEEYLKNIIIFKYQGNLNPFILNPELMIYSFADKIEADDELLSKNCHRYIDPFHSIDYLIDEIKTLEYQRDKDYKLLRKLTGLKQSEQSKKKK